MENKNMRKLNVTVQCMAVYNSSIMVPRELTFEEAIKYAKEHIDEINLGELEYISDSDELDEENCDFDEEEDTDSDCRVLYETGIEEPEILGSGSTYSNVVYFPDEERAFEEFHHCGQNIMRIELLDTYGILRIKTTEFLFDLEDLPLIKGRDSWYCDKDGYLVSSYFYNGVRRFVRFHRLVMHAKPGQCVDHINKNKADNRKKNLRCCERSENDRNRSLYSCNTSGVAGVYFDKQRKKWVASITYNHKKVYLGRYAVKEEAILARLTKEVELYKEFSPQRELLESLNL